jgi:putative FmdB family regulatory protein
MPIYAYKAIEPATACDYCETEFELLRSLSAEELTHCPECGKPVVQIISAPNLQSGDANLLDNSNIAKHGFTQYKRAGDGVYEKAAGAGPRYISDDGK